MAAAELQRPNGRSASAVAGCDRTTSEQHFVPRRDGATVDACWATFDTNQDDHPSPLPMTHERADAY